jgi:valyl-tRNA synthetase
LYHFAWDEVCDWYIELAKLSLSGRSAAATQRVLGEVLDALLRLLHPMIPFVTEALWTALTGGESLVVAEWPKADASRADATATAEVQLVRDVVTEGRRFRSEQGVKPSQRVPARVSGAPPYAEAAISSLLRLDAPGDGFAATAELPAAADVTIVFDLSGAIDVAAERARLAKARAAAEKDRAVNTGKLGNEAFTAKAPESVIAKVRDRLAAAEAELRRIDAALEALPPDPRG